MTDWLWSTCDTRLQIKTKLTTVNPFNDDVALNLTTTDPCVHVPKPPTCRNGICALNLQT